ncbi:MAG: hypothetical protein HWD59_02960 [Coxiellaceae bacterium]|nr:MAG: hypothetical protein HWD59_02960 [Coxiellaceae bacterium]
MLQKFISALILSALSVIAVAATAPATPATPATPEPAAAQSLSPDQIDYPWSVMFYAGKLVDENLLQVFSMNFGDETLYSLELAKELSPDNMLRRYVQPLVTTVAIAGNVAYRTDPDGPIYEFDPYVTFRWEHFPWDKFLVNTYAIGWGVSYVTRVPTWEAEDSTDTKQLLNYLMFETTLALPKHPQWQLVLRIHHRSGAFGLYGADNAGSNVIGLGIRYNF